MKTSQEMLKEAQEMLGLKQKELGVYAGVGAKTVNTWMKGKRTCPDHVAEMVLRLAKVDAKALKEGEPTTDMMRWAVIESSGIDEFITVCGSKNDALKAAEENWNHLTESEKKKLEIFAVGLIHVQLMEKNGIDGRFTYAENENGWVDGDIYECEKDYIGG